MFDEEDIYDAQKVESILSEKYGVDNPLKISKKDLPKLQEVLEEAEAYEDDEHV